MDITDFDAFFADTQDMGSQRLCNETNLPLSAKLLRERLEKPAPLDVPNCWLAIESLEEGCLVGSVSTSDTPFVTAISSMASRFFASTGERGLQ